MDSERRRLYRHGVLLLLLSAVLGLVVAAQPPHAGKWMAAHVSGLMTGILLIGLGALWPEIPVEERRLAAARSRWD